MLMVIVAAAAFGPLITGNDAIYKPDLANIVQSPSLSHPLGTDQVGRDAFARLLVGGRATLLVGLAAMLVSITIGVMVGILSGYYRGVVDDVLMRITDAFIVIPTFMVIIVLSVMIGPGLVTIIVAIGLTQWKYAARTVRALFLSLRAHDFVVAARSVGVSDLGIMLRHILPNAMSPIIVAASLGVAFAIILESSVSYLGLGVQAPTPSWGNMLRGAQNEMWRAPWLAVAPGVVIVITVMSINFIGDGLRDALDPWSTKA